MSFILGTQGRVRNSRGKRAISIQVIEVLLLFFFCFFFLFFEFFNYTMAYEFRFMIKVF